MRKHAGVKPKHDAVLYKGFEHLQVWASESGRRIPGVSSLWISRVIDDGVCAHTNRGWGRVEMSNNNRIFIT